jgi:hypothetical protein
MLGEDPAEVGGFHAKGHGERRLKEFVPARGGRLPCSGFVVLLGYMGCFDYVAKK